MHADGLLLPWKVAQLATPVSSEWVIARFDLEEHARLFVATVTDGLAYEVRGPQ